MGKKHTKTRGGKYRVSNHPKHRERASQLLQDRHVICCTCRRVLDTFPGDGIVSVRHNLTDKRLGLDDHRPVAAIGTPDPAHLVCDFCSVVGVSALYITMKLVNTLQLMSPDASDAYIRPLGPQWWACSRCAEIINRGKLNELTDRSCFFLAHGEGIPRAHYSWFRARIVELHRAFFEARPVGPFEPPPFSIMERLDPADQ